MVLDSRLAVELRSLRDTLAMLFVIGAVLALGVVVAVGGHLGPGAMTLLTFAIGACVAIAFIALKLRSSSGNAAAPTEPRSTARVVPTIVNAAFLSFAAYRVGSLLIAMHRHENVSRDDFVLACGLLAFLAWTFASDARQRWFGWQPKPATFTQRRRAELEAAYSMPSFGEYQRAIAPLRKRGFARVAILVAMIVGMVSLAPHTGIAVAAFIAFGAAAGTFLLLHKLIDL